MHAESCIST